MIVRCVACARPAPTDRAYCHYCRWVRPDTVSAYPPDTRPDDEEDPAEIERRFEAAKRRAAWERRVSA